MRPVGDTWSDSVEQAPIAGSRGVDKQHDIGGELLDMGGIEMYVSSDYKHCCMP
jgi:hypothetical protein